jgi:hypothetical protein
MWRTVTVLLIVLVMPISVSAGPLKAAAEKAGRELASAQQGQEVRSRGRFWTGISLLAGGGILAALGSVELGDDEVGPDDGEDFDESDDGEDSDGWGNKALIGGGISAAAIGTILLFTGRESLPSVAVRHGRVTVRQTLRF